MNKNAVIPLSVIGLGVIILLALQFGSSAIHIFSMTENAENILFNIRIPRIMLGLAAGLVLATSGGVLQGMLHNPLAEPYLLGISSGAALGSIAGLLLRKIYLMPLFGFAGALLSMLLVWNIAQQQRYVDKTKLILSGIIVNMFFSAIIALLMSIFRQDLSQIFSILMGNLGYMFSSSNIYLLWVIILCAVSGTIILNIYALRLNVLSLGDYSATSLGVDVYKTRKVLFVLTSFLVGIIVAFVGIIGFVGLIIPHISRMMVGSNNKLVLPLAGILGAGFLIFCDTIARSILVIELPVGVITALFGAPFFVYLLKRK